MDYPDEILEFLGDLAGAEEVLNDMTKDQIIEEETPDVEDVEIVDSSHVQIRIWKSGPKGSDGRHGDIVIEDLQAPIEVAQWLRSAQCRKVTGPRKRIYVWIDDVLLDNRSSLPIPEEDAEERTVSLPARQGDQFASTQAYQERLEKTAQLAERQLQATLAAYEDQIHKAREYRDKEVATCYRSIEDARLRLARELHREDAEIEAINVRRSVISNQRTDLAGDLNSFQSVMVELKEKMQAPEKEEAGLVERVSDVIKLANDESIQSGIGSLLQMYFTAKEKTGKA